MDGFDGEIPDFDEEEEIPVVPPAENELGGHFTLAPSIAWSAPRGRFESGLQARESLDAGPGFGAEVGVGVGRHVVLGGWVQYLTLPGDCSGCSAQSIAGGGFLRYHLVQGVKFDPWVSFGMGVRSTTLDLGPTETTYRGFEWFRLAVGGDWYATKVIAFGPFFEIDAGHYLDVSNGSIGSGRPHASLHAGFRGVLNIPGR